MFRLGIDMEGDFFYIKQFKYHIAYSVVYYRSLAKPYMFRTMDINYQTDDGCYFLED